MTLPAIPIAEGGALLSALARRLEVEERWIGTHRAFSPAAREALLGWLARRWIHLCRAPLLGAAPRAFTPGLYETALRTYPVLARLSASARAAWREQCVLLARRLSADGIGELEALEVLGGSSVPPSALALTLASGKRLVYRPRDVRVGAWFQALCRDLNDAGLPVPLHIRRLTARRAYAWDDWVAGETCADPAAIERYFVRAGELLRLLQLLRAHDMHRRNVVAAGEHPVIVDFDGLFRPLLPERSSLERSPYGTGLLPVWVAGEIGRPALNGGGIQRAGGVMPYARLDISDDGLRLERRYKAETSPATAPASPHAHRDDILRGYDEMERLLARVDLRVRLEQAATLPVRYFARPVAQHRLVLAQSLLPDRLRAEGTRDAFLAARIDGPWAHAERACLRDGVVPVFGAIPGSDGVVLPDGTLHAGVFAGRALDGLRRTIDRRRDHEVILTALAVAEVPAPVPPRVAWVPCDLDWRGAAGAIADQVIAAGLEVGVVWLPWAGVRRLGPLPADVLSGTAGAAIVLARLHAATGVTRYRDAAIRALEPVRRAVEKQKKAAWLGAYLGLGGQLHGLRVCGELLGDAAALALAAGRLATLRDDPAIPAAADDVVGGLPGLAAACRDPWLAQLLDERERAGLRAPPYPSPDGLPPDLPTDALAWARARLSGAAPAPPDEARARDLAGRHAACGSWLPESLIPDRLNPCAVSGLLGVAHLFLRVADPSIPELV